MSGDSERGALARTLSWCVQVPAVSIPHVDCCVGLMWCCPIVRPLVDAVCIAADASGPLLFFLLSAPRLRGAGNDESLWLDICIFPYR